jgi:hypothetical protein
MVGISVGAYSKVGSDAVEADETLWTFGRALAAQSRVGSDSTELSLKFGRSLGASAKVGADTSGLILSCGRAIAADSKVGRDEFLLLSLLGKIVYPPSAELFLLKNGEEEQLDGNQLTRADFYAFNLRIVGDRVASEVNGSVNVTFTGKADPAHLDSKALFRKTLQNGGVKFLGVEDIVTYNGKTRAATYQIRLLPQDTAALMTPAIVYADIQLDDGTINGEHYTVNRSRFSVSDDIYRGIGGGK